ncbi:MAG TPA: glycoside hydrolase family 1 protein [Patescibacteria group bacterium]|nr:glycoside hydrolase family 1 protein [Patescibacteria group bacterium]
MERVFPEGFLWGTAISSFQAEMGRGEPSKGTDWWAWVHDPENIKVGRVSGDSPVDGPGFWELYDDDLEMCRSQLGGNSVRLSIDWGRIFPEPTSDVEVNVKRDKFDNVCQLDIDNSNMDALERLADVDALTRYREILSSAIRHGLTPMLTLYHWPIPLWLHDPVESRDTKGNCKANGWLSQGTLVEFGKFSAYVAHRLGDLVDVYGTVNEPRIVAEHGYLTERGEFPPGLNDPELFLRCLKNVSMAHGMAYEQVKRWDKVKASAYGPSYVGLVSVLQSYVPADPGNPDDVRMSRYVEYMFNEWGLNAVFHGDYDMDADMVVEPGEQLLHLVKGCDFLGVNYYSLWRVKHKEGGHPLLSYGFEPCTGNCSEYGWEIHPEGLREVLAWAYGRYRRPIFVTENGIADAKDEKRVRYLRSHVEQVHRAIEVDGVPVMGYYYWSLMDNFEWSDGYRPRFGLFNVDRDTKRRIPKKSVEAYREIASKNSLL